MYRRQAVAKLTASFSVYLGFRAVQILGALLLIPVLTHSLSSEDYGKVTLFQSLIILFIPFMEMGHVVRRQYFSLNPASFAASLRSALYIICINGLILFLVTEALFHIIPAFPHWGIQWVLCALIVALLTACLNLASSVWQAMARPWYYGTANLAYCLGSLLLSILFIVWLHMGWKAPVIGFLLASAMTGTISLALLWRQCPKKPDGKDGLLLANWKRQGLLLPYMACTGAYLYIGNLILATQETLSDVALFGLGLQLGKLIGIYSESSVNAMIPQLYSYLNSKTDSGKKDMIAVLAVWVAGLLTICVTLSMVAGWVLGWIAPALYQAVANFFPWIAAAFFFQGMARLFHQYILFFKNQQVLLSWATVCTILATIFINMLLINLYGTAGAAIGLFAGYFLWASASAGVGLYIRHVHKLC